MLHFMTLLLTTFISVNGHVQTVSADSTEVQAYEQEAVTDIGNPDNLDSTLSIEETQAPETETTETETSEKEIPEQTIQIVTDNTEEIALLSEAVELMAENSSTVTGTVNTTVLNLMDRMVDSYPDYYKYAGFRIDSDDSYRTTLYLSKRATSDGNTIAFGDDCIAVNFYRYYENNYSSYVYYDVTESPNASVDVNSNSIVYTNALKGYPSLGTKEQTDTSLIWILLLVGASLIIFTRRNKT